MKSLVGWLVTALFFLALGAGTAWLLLREHEAEDEDEGPSAVSQPAEEAAEPPLTLSKDQAGSTVLALSDQARARLGLRMARLATATTRPAVEAFGKLIEDPSAGFTLHAPLAGQLAAAGEAWPSVGARVEAGTVLGSLRPTLGATERADLGSRLVNARADAQAAEASVSALRASYESRRRINREEPIVSDLTLQEAAAKLAGEEARLNAARETIRILEMWTSTTRPAEEARLIVPVAGLVSEVGAQPGEAVEAGRMIIRVIDPARLLAAVNVPIGSSRGPFESATVLLLGPQRQLLPLHAGQPVSASTADPQTGGAAWLAPVEADGRPLQPGTPVTAWLHTGQGTIEGVLVPAAALVRLEGKAWVYAAADEGLVRLPVNLVQPMADGWLVQGATAGQEIVVEGAGGLLSAELHAAAGVGEEEE